MVVGGKFGKFFPICQALRVLNNQPSWLKQVAKLYQKVNQINQ